MLIAAAGVRRNRSEQELDYHHEAQTQRTAVRLRNLSVSARHVWFCASSGR